MTAIPKPTKRPKKAKKVKRNSLKNKADALFRGLIVDGSGYIGRKCRNPSCGHRAKGYAIQCAHVFSRRYLSIRWDIRNAVPLCAGCHMFFTHHPIEWEEWMRDYLGAEVYEVLRMKALRPHTFSYEDVIAELQNGRGTECLT